MGYAEIIAAAVAAISAFVSAGKEGEAQRLRERMAAEYGPEILPDLDKAVAQQAGPSAFQSATENDSGRSEQLDVLRELENEYQTGGRSDADMAAYDVAKRKVAQQGRARAGDIAIEGARRGQAGGTLGAVLASQAGQDELDALASMDADLASSGRGRAMQALGMRGQMASGLRGDDWRSLEARASATDLMDRFNASQRQQSELYNVTLPQQQYDNNMQRLAAQNAAREGQAAGYERSGAAARQTGAGIANSAMSFGAAWDKQNEEDDD